MIVAIHQPDLLPYSGFWFKMISSDVFVIAQHDQFQKHGYQRRVTMRDAWCSHQLEGKPSLVPITAVRVLPGWQDRLIGIVRGRYTGARHWKSRGLPLLDRIADCSGETLAEVNLSMIHVLRDVLDIRTPLAFTDPPAASGVPRLIEQVQAVGGTAYLSGAGATAYMGDDATATFAEAGIELRWSHHEITSGDSVLTVLMDHDDPVEVISRTC
ncbi:WbqC family protein [Allobranchiibius sp. GilTou38]|uniref:WbqC family protein n=1 Tax=Allobranchiibius sp. GilTou38 TaxID=2815210 RepID=UPI001AA0EACE|nr:WbqC family protein [Allobranchiibius sp. GilTou38]